ncbi:MAG: hypothetical protein GXO08_00870, partial [Aquificae bacterium]|nr:hypothetical protein [Aquificota bacterium]
EFADAEHGVIAKALNAIAKALARGDRDLAFNKLLPAALEYLDRHLTHEERVLENAILYWAEEKGLGDELESFYQSFRRYLRLKGKSENDYSYKDFLEFSYETGFTDSPLFKLVDLLEHQKKGHAAVKNQLLEELSKINPEEEPKRILAELGLAVSFVLNRVLKLDKKYVDFYKRYGIPACGEKPLLPPPEVLRLVEKVLKEEERKTET